MISKGKSESVYRRRAYNTMAKRKRTKGQKDKKRSTEHTHKTKDRVTIDTPSTNTRRLTFVA
jgi:hypothetical protein